jgi:hypothetical protein
MGAFLRITAQMSRKGLPPPSPPTLEQHLALREKYAYADILDYLASVEAWLMGIRKQSKDTRNSDPAALTRVDFLIRQCRQFYKIKRYTLAGEERRRLEHAVALINEKLTAREARAGRGVLQGAKRGGDAKAESKRTRNRALAQEFQALQATRPMLSRTAAMVIVGKAHKLGRSAAIEAVKAGLAEIVR